jgi:hypothetical protein
MAVLFALVCKLEALLKATKLSYSKMCVCERALGFVLQFQSKVHTKAAANHIDDTLAREFKSSCLLLVNLHFSVNKFL